MTTRERMPYIARIDEHALRDLGGMGKGVEWGFLVWAVVVFGLGALPFMFFFLWIVKLGARARFEQAGRQAGRQGPPALGQACGSSEPVSRGA